MRIFFEHTPKINTLSKGVFKDISHNALYSELENFIYCGSGKAAIAAILDFLRNNGVLMNKVSPIFVPKWVGIEVYKTILEYAFPVINPNSRAKVLIAYHQYGFPQNMDRIMDIADSRKMIVIEDCAHALNSMYKGKMLGTIGDFSIYSFSKFCFCFALGGIGYKSVDFNEFFQKRLKATSNTLRFVINSVKLLDTCNAGRGGGRLINLPFTHGLTKMAYSRYGDSLSSSKYAIRMFENQFVEEKSLRKKNYQFVRERLAKYGACDHLEEDNVIPYAIPLNLPEKISERAANVLKSKGYETGIYHFDMNRCVFDPSFRKTMLIPCHSGLYGRPLEKMMDIVVKEIQQCSM
jgi:hypothetical protein